MNRYLSFVALFAAIIIFANCGSSKKAVAAAPAKLTYETTMQTVMTSYCSPCHIPSKGGNKKAYDNYENIKADIDDIIHRVQMEPGSRGFMPFKRSKLSDSTIALIKQWKTDGMLEK